MYLDRCLYIQCIFSMFLNYPWLKGKKMLETIAVILVILWILGLVSSSTMGGFIHVLLVIAVIVILVRVVQGRRL